MATEFFPILPPAQMLETLDNWGSLDSLPLSLDSTAWATAGIYGITITDGAKASGRMDGSRQSVIPISASLAQSGDTFANARRVRTNSLSASATTGGKVTYQRIRNDAVVSGVAVFETCLPLRIRQASVAGEVVATASVSWLRVRSGEGLAQASGVASVALWLRTRTASVAAEGVTGGTATGYLIRSLQATATAQTGQASAFIRTRLDSGEITALAVGKLDFVRLLHLVESEPGKGGERFTAYRVRPHRAALSAESDQSIAALRIRRDILAETARATEEVDGLRIRTETSKEKATAAARVSFVRLKSSAITGSVYAIAEVEAFQLTRGLSLYGLSKAVGFANGVGVLELRGGLLAAAGGNLALSVSYALSGSGSGVAGGLAAPSIVLGISASDVAQSGERAILGFKGWGWDGEKPPSAPVWKQKNEQLNPWMQKPENAAVWVAQSVTAKDWTQKQGGVAQWQ